MYVRTCLGLHVFHSLACAFRLYVGACHCMGFIGWQACVVFMSWGSWCVRPYVRLDPCLLLLASAGRREEVGGEVEGMALSLKEKEE